jgi:hypothetical protein
MKDRTHACIALGPTGNIQGSLKCFNIDTGKIIKCQTITLLPMPDQIVKKVRKWGKCQSKYDLSKDLIFLIGTSKNSTGTLNLMRKWKVSWKP